MPPKTSKKKKKSKKKMFEKMREMAEAEQPCKEENESTREVLEEPALGEDVAAPAPKQEKKKKKKKSKDRDVEVDSGSVSKKKKERKKKGIQLAQEIAVDQIIGGHEDESAAAAAAAAAAANSLPTPTGKKLSNKERRRLKKAQSAAQRMAAEEQKRQEQEHRPFSLQSVSIGNTQDFENSQDIRLDSFTIAGQGKGTNLFVNAELKIVHGRRYGLIGPNGMGKTTLLRLLMDGTLPMPANIDKLHVEQEVEGSDIPAVEAVLSADGERVRLLNEEISLTAEFEETGSADTAEKLRAVYESLQVIGAASAEARARKILSGLGFSPEMQTRPTKHFSGGWRMRISLARALFMQPTLLLLDEPTNHLDLNAVLWLDSYLQKWKNTLLVVSHDQDFLDSVVTDIIHLDQKKLFYYPGSYQHYKTASEQARATQQKAYEKQQKQLRALKRKNVSSKDAAKKVKQRERGRQKGQKHRKQEAKADAGAGVPSELIERPKEYRVKIFFPEVSVLAPPIIEVMDVSFNYPNGPTLFDNLNFGITQDSRISIVGPNGSGKSTLLNLITGVLEPTTGEIRRNHKMRIGKYSQHFVDQLPMGPSPVDFLREHDVEMSYQEARNLLGKYGLGGHAHTIPISQLSGGQKARVMLAQISVRQPHILFLDEPTNHLDIETIDALATGINAFNGGVVLVSHDARLVQEAECELWIVGGKTVTRYEADFEEYREELLEELEAAEAEEAERVAAKLAERERLAAERLERARKAAAEGKVRKAARAVADEAKAEDADADGDGDGDE